MYFVYILKCADQTLYSGITTDLDRRIKEHNFSKLGAKYTKARRPVALVFSQKCQTRSRACVLEARIKSWTRAQKEEFLNQCKAKKSVLK